MLQNMAEFMSGVTDMPQNFAFGMFSILKPNTSFKVLT